MAPWPGMSRGTDCTVPMVPGLVRVTVAPAKSSGESLPVRTLRIISSYDAQKPAKSRPSAPRMTGTSRVRLPSFFSRSTARPRLTRSLLTLRGVPSGPATNVPLRAGTASAMARTTA
jgi:hypothetical protein